jgi:hypothetical protein
VPHWKYIDTARTFRLHVPAGYTSTMFTHLPSRSVFIDNDRYVSDDSLGYWLAHELGHLAANSASENDADKAAREYRKRLKDATQTRRTLVFTGGSAGSYARLWSVDGQPFRNPVREGLPTIHPEPRLSLPTTPFVDRTSD